MTVKSANVFTGAPDQATTGAILCATLGTALPSSIAGVIDPAFKDAGYIDDNGLKLTPNRSTKSIKDWSNKVIRNVLDEFDTTLNWAHLETNGASLANYWGDANVTVTPATATAGTQTATQVTADDLPHKSWAMKIKDGSRKVLIVIPDGQVSKNDPIEFKSSQAVVWGVELTCYPDANGVYIYLYTDDGVFTA